MYLNFWNITFYVWKIEIIASFTYLRNFFILDVLWIANSCAKISRKWQAVRPNKLINIWTCIFSNFCEEQSGVKYMANFNFYSFICLFVFLYLFLATLFLLSQAVMTVIKVIYKFIPGNFVMRLRCHYIHQLHKNSPPWLFVLFFLSLLQ